MLLVTGYLLLTYYLLMVDTYLPTLELARKISREVLGLKYYIRDIHMLLELLCGIQDDEAIFSIKASK